MILGQFAAVLAIDRNIAVQEVDYDTLKGILENKGQIVEYYFPWYLDYRFLAILPAEI